MSDSSVIVAYPPGPTALVLVFHGVGSTAANLVPVARLIAQHRPRAAVVSVSAPNPSGLGGEREWFSVTGIDEANRAARIAQAMPAFEHAVAHWQAHTGLDPQRTTLVGFSQGAIMSLESTQALHLAARVVGIAGRFAVPPQRARAGVVFRLVHGTEDPVIDPRFSVEGAAALRALGADASVQLVPGLGHGIDERAARCVLQALD